MKTCNKCKEVKNLTEFNKSCKGKDGLREQCKACLKSYNAKRYQDNKDKIAERQHQYYQDNKDKCLKRKKGYYKENKEEIIQYTINYREKNKAAIAKKRRASQKERYHTDPIYKLKCNLRSRFNHALNGKGKHSSILDLIGCSISELKLYLENLFLQGMSWKNHGEWHIDHIVPCASFDLSCPKQQQKCFHYTNLQPLWATDNLIKG